MSIVAIGFGQNISAKHFPEKASFKMEQDLKQGTIVLLTPNVSLNFSRFQKQVDGWKFVGTLTPGASYNLVVGEGTEQADGSVSVQPYVSFGIFADGGFVVNNSGQLGGSFNIGGALGIYKFINLCVGYDAIQKVPFIGIGATVSIFTFKSGAGATILKF